MSNSFDIIIIGSGAGGGTLALKLAPSGKRILILERGGYLPREKQNWDATEVFVKNRYVSKDTWYDKDNKAFQPGVHYFVGGATKMFGAALFRLAPARFHCPPNRRRNERGLADPLRGSGTVLLASGAALQRPRPARR